MLEVGVTNAQLPLPGKKCNCGPTLEEPCPPLTVTEAKSHFGAWAIVSSPLILGFNLTDETQMSLHWCGNVFLMVPFSDESNTPVCQARLGTERNETSTQEAFMSCRRDTITNRHALEVNQDYAGFSGSRFAQSAQTETFAPCDWGPSPGRDNATCEWPRTWSWYKPLSGRDARSSTMAVLLMNNGNASATLGFQWREVPGLSNATTGCYRLFDVWAGESRGEVKGAGYTARNVAARDSVFLTLAACD